MPKKDGTGPIGKGPLTGRGSGHCAIPINTPDEELGFLKNQEKVLREELRQVEVKIKTLEPAVSGGKK
jgi:hypothetical protein